MRQIIEGKGTSKIAPSPAEQDALRRAAKARRRHNHGKSSCDPSSKIYMEQTEKDAKVAQAIEAILKWKLENHPDKFEVAQLACAAYADGKNIEAIERQVYRKYDTKVALIGMRAFRAELVERLNRDKLLATTR